MEKKVVVKWKCTAPKKSGDGQFNNPVACSNDSVYNKESGWICDCGRWTTGENAFHKPLKTGIREIIDCQELRKGIDINAMLNKIPDSKRRILEDESICKFCEIKGCPGPVRFDKNYLELGYIETNLPFCPHTKYRGDKQGK
jgi:hypothetical protein